MLGVGNSLYHSLGKAYLDDNIEKTKTPMVLACVLCLRMVGPLIGFGLGYYMLRVFIDPTKTPLITSKDPRWIGAYWIGWIIIGFAVMVFAILIGMFPREFKSRNSNATVEKTKSDVKAYSNGPEFAADSSLTGQMENHI